MREPSDINNQIEMFRKRFVDVILDDYVSYS
jgi:hypothetical protein